MTETLSPALPEDIEEETHRLLSILCDRALTVATAESCTGGLLASLLTDVEGCAHAFDRGFVTYTDKAKTEMLDVPAGAIAEHGAVSRIVAVAMAEGALTHSGATVALAVTGFAGKGAQDEEAGLVHFGCARRGRETRHREMHFGDIGRGPVRLACVRTALEMLDEALS